MQTRLTGPWARGGLTGIAVGLTLLAGCAPAAPATRPAATASPAASAPQAPGGQEAFAVAPAATAGSPASPPATATPELPKIRFHVPSRSTSYLPWYLAIERGYFREQNLDVELFQVPGTTGYQAMIG